LCSDSRSIASERAERVGVGIDGDHIEPDDGTKRWCYRSTLVVSSGKRRDATAIRVC
jgi:hypothetical protein